MQKPVFILAVLVLFVTDAEAFSHAACLAKSQAPPFNMGEKDALAVCDAKTRSGGKGKVGNVLYSLVPSENTYSAEAFAKSLDKYLDEGNLRTTICYEGCRLVYIDLLAPRCFGFSSWCRTMVTKTVRTEVPYCPAGYELVANALGSITRAHTNQLYGSHGKIRTGLCRKS